MQNTDEEFLDQALKNTTGKTGIRPDEYARLTSLFVPTTPSATRGKAFLVLSSLCDYHRRTSHNSTAQDDPGTHNIVHTFLPAVESKLTDVVERPLCEAISFMAALFAVDWRSAAAIFERDGFQDSMMDSLDLFPSSTEIPIVVSSVLASACGYKSCRSALSPRCSAWLESTFQHTTNTKLRAAVSLALLKTSQGADAEGDVKIGVAGDSNVGSGERREELFKSLRDILVGSSGSVQDIADVVEGLAYLSTTPSIKVRIVDDEELLKKIVSLRTSLQKKATQIDDFGTTPFGLAAMIANICSYRPQLTEEQAQIMRLKRMAQPGAAKSKDVQDQPISEEELDDDEHVRLRGRRLIAAGITDLLVSIARATDSAAARMVIGKALLGLVEEKENRGKVLQAGGAKTLMVLIRASLQRHDPESKNPLTKANMDFEDLLSIQALAKLAITASPMQVFGPNENVSIEAIKPFACLLLHPSSTLLQKFESMMALTNIASASPELADRITQTDGLLSKIEFLLLEENLLVRRAATELLCNLVSGSELAFNRYSGDGDGSSESSGSLNQSKSRLHVLIALADVDDEPTRLAASGALAVLTASPTACRLLMLLEFEHHRVFLALKELIDPSEEAEEAQEEQGERTVQTNPGLVHRGAVCVRNIFINLSDDALRSKLASEAVRHGMVDALANIIKAAGQGNGTEAVLRPTAEALKWLMDSGVNVLA